MERGKYLLPATHPILSSRIHSAFSLCTSPDGTVTLEKWPSPTPRDGTVTLEKWLSPTQRDGTVTLEKWPGPTQRDGTVTLEKWPRWGALR